MSYSVPYPKISINISAKNIPTIMVVLGIVFIFIDLITPTNIINLFLLGIFGVILFVLGLILFLGIKYL